MLPIGRQDSVFQVSWPIFPAAGTGRRKPRCYGTICGPLATGQPPPVVFRSYDLLRPTAQATPQPPREGGSGHTAFPWFVCHGSQRLIDKAGNLRRSLMMLCSRHPAQVARRRAIEQMLVQQQLGATRDATRGPWSPVDDQKHVTKRVFPRKGSWNGHEYDKFFGDPATTRGR